MRLPSHVASLNTPAGSTFSTSTASCCSSMARCTVKRVRAISDRRNGAAFSRSSRPRNAVFAMLKNFNPNR